MYMAIYLQVFELHMVWVVKMIRIYTLTGDKTLLVLGEWIDNTSTSHSIGRVLFLVKKILFSGVP